MEKTKLNVRKRERSEIEEEEFKALQVINKLASTDKSKGECEIFGELIATALKTLNQKQRLLAKHEIQNVLFKIRMRSLEFDLKDRPTEHPSTSTKSIYINRVSIYIYIYFGFIVPVNCTIFLSAFPAASFRWLRHKPAGIFL